MSIRVQRCLCCPTLHGVNALGKDFCSLCWHLSMLQVVCSYSGGICVAQGVTSLGTFSFSQLVLAALFGVTCMQVPAMVCGLQRIAVMETAPSYPARLCL